MDEKLTNADDALIDRLAGHSGALVAKGAVMRYVAGAVRRERQRLAEIFEAVGMREVAERVRDTSLDSNVFRFRPPSVDLHRQTTEPTGAGSSTTFTVGTVPKDAESSRKSEPNDRT